MSRSAGAPLVLVLPLRARGAPWACRSLRRRGFDVLGADPDGDWKTRSRYCPDLVRLPADTADPRAFAAEVERLCRARDVVAILPLDDAILRALAPHRNELAPTVLVGPTPAQIATLLDKRALVDAGTEAGLDSPLTVLVDGTGADAPLPALPSIVKARSNGLGTHSGVPVPLTTLAGTEAERDEAVGRFVAAFGEALVQELVTGQAWRIHFVRTRQGLATAAVHTVRRYPQVTGLSSVSRAAHAPDDLLAACERLLARADYRGPGELELLERDARFVLHDVNLRLSASVGVAIEMGLDVPGLAVADALELPAEDGAPRRDAFYVTVEGEGAHLVDALRRRPASAPAWRIAADIAGAALLPGRRLDPFDLRDPRRTAATVATALRRRAAR